MGSGTVLSFFVCLLFLQVSRCLREGEGYGEPRSFLLAEHTRHPGANRQAQPLLPAGGPHVGWPRLAACAALASTLSQARLCLSIQQGSMSASRGRSLKLASNCQEPRASWNEARGSDRGES